MNRTKLLVFVCQTNSLVSHLVQPFLVFIISFHKFLFLTT